MSSTAPFAEDIPLDSISSITTTAPSNSMGTHDSSVGEAMPEDAKQEEVSKSAPTTPVGTSQWAAMPLEEAQAACQLANKAPTDNKDSSDVGAMRDNARPTEVVRKVETRTPVATSHQTAIPFGVAQPATLEFTHQDSPSNLEYCIQKDSAVEDIHETVTPAEVPRKVVLTPITTIQQIALPRALAAATAEDSPNTTSEMDNGISKRVSYSNVTRNAEVTPYENTQRTVRPPAIPEGPSADLHPTDRPSDSDKLPALTKGQMYRVASRDLTSTLTDQAATKSAEAGRTSQGEGNDRRRRGNEVAKLVMDVDSGFRMQVANLSQYDTSKTQASLGSPCKRSSRLGRAHVSKQPGTNHDNAAEPANRMADKTKTVERGKCRPWTDEENDIFFNAIICKCPTKEPDEAWNQVAACFPALNPQVVKRRLRAFVSGNAYLSQKYKEYGERRDLECRLGKHAKSTKNPGEESDEEEQSRKPAAVPTSEECNLANKKGTEPRKRSHSTSSSPAGCSERMNRRMGVSIKDGKRAMRSRVESDDEQESLEPAALITAEEYKHTKKGTGPRKRKRTPSRSSSPAGCSQYIKRINCRIRASHKVGDTITDAPVVERTSKRGRVRCTGVERNVENYACISDARRSSGASRSRATTGLLPDTTDSGPLNSLETERHYEENRLRATRDRIQRLLLDRRQILGQDRNLHDNLCRELEDEIERIERKLLQLYLEWEREDARAVQYDS